MKINAIHLENFKGIQERQRIELKPITLLFGANSVGKSTILQALLYLNEILNHQNLDPHKVEIGGDSVDLGGFENMVNQHDISKDITFGIELDAEGYSFDDLPKHPLNTIPESHTYEYFEILESDELVNIEKTLKTISFQFSICMSGHFSNIHEKDFKIFINGINIFKFINKEDNSAEQGLEINRNHPVFTSYKKEIDEVYPQHEDYIVPMCIALLRDLLPKREDTYEGIGAGSQLSRSGYVFIRTLLCHFVAAPLNFCRDQINEMRYIGPLRKVPMRKQSSYNAIHGNENWADGTAAWSSLEKTSKERIKEINSWINGSEKLNLGYEIKHQTYYTKLPTNHINNIPESVFSSYNKVEIKKALKDYYSEFPIEAAITLFDTKSKIEIQPYDIGVGISQVIPVVVAIFEHFDRYNDILSIEQPELHLHPRAQTILADLLTVKLQQHIDSRKENDRRFNKQILIETHSEYLLERLLKHIAETTEKDDDNLSHGLKLSHDDIAVYHVENEDKGTKYQLLKINEHGNFNGKWPVGFFENVKNKFYHSIELSNQLDGELNQFGEKFWNELLKQDEKLKQALEWKIPTSIDYTDTYINTPSSLLLLSEIFVSLKAKATWKKEPGINIITRDIPAYSKGLLTKSWKNKKIQSEVIEKYFRKLDQNVSVDVQSRKIPHARLLTIHWNDLSLSKVILDQGVGSWKINHVAQNEEYDTSDDVDVQVSWLLENRQKFTVENVNESSKIHIGINNTFTE